MSYSFEKLSVLIVEGQTPVRDLLAAQLHAMGVGQVLVSSTAAEGYQLALANTPDIILTDWETGDETGLDLTRWVRNNTTHPIRTAPIIMMTGYTARYRKDTARDTGITEYLEKPFAAPELARAILYVIEHPRDFIETDTFFGPDRRRLAADFKGPDRRNTQAKAAS